MVIIVVPSDTGLVSSDAALVGLSRPFRLCIRLSSAVLSQGPVSTHPMQHMVTLAFCPEAYKPWQLPSDSLAWCRSADVTGQDRSQSPNTPVANAPLALTPVHTRYPEEGSGSVQPPSARPQPAMSAPRRAPPGRSATFPRAASSASKSGSSAAQRSKAQHVSDKHASGSSIWEQESAGGSESLEESMQPGTPTSGCTPDAMWEQHAHSPWSLRLSHCKPLKITRQHSSSDASTSKTLEDVSTPCSPKASPKITVVCRICEEQASSFLHVGGLSCLTGLLVGLGPCSLQHQTYRV